MEQRPPAGVRATREEASRREPTEKEYQFLKEVLGALEERAQNLRRAFRQYERHHKDQLPAGFRDFAVAQQVALGKSNRAIKAALGRQFGIDDHYWENLHYHLQAERDGEEPVWFPKD